jgi:hypothetical protein
MPHLRKKIALKPVGPPKDKGIWRGPQNIVGLACLALTTELRHHAENAIVAVPGGGLVTRLPNSNIFGITGVPGYPDFLFNADSNLLFRGSGNGQCPSPSCVGRGDTRSLGLP